LRPQAKLLPPCPPTPAQIQTQNYCQFDPMRPKPAAEPDREAAAPRNLTRERERDLGHYLTSGAGDGERGLFGESEIGVSDPALRWLGAFSGEGSRRRGGLRGGGGLYGAPTEAGRGSTRSRPLPSRMESHPHDTSWRGELSRISFRCAGGSLTPGPGGLGPLVGRERYREHLCFFTSVS
jgi:hypothetical protein